LHDVVLTELWSIMFANHVRPPKLVKLFASWQAVQDAPLEMGMWLTEAWVLIGGFRPG
jgi:hypothetical protein